MIVLPHGGFPLIPATIAAMAWMTSLSLDGCDYVRLTGPAVTTLTRSKIYPYVEIGFHSYRVPSFYSEFGSWQVRFTDPCIPFSDLDVLDTRTSSRRYLQRQERQQNNEDEQEEREVQEQRQYPREQHPQQYAEDANYKGSSNDYRMIQNPTYGFFWTLGSMCHKFATIIGGSATLSLWVPCLCFSYTARAWRIAGIQLLIASFFHLCSLLWFFNIFCTERGSQCHLFYGSYTTLASFCLYLVSFMCVFWKYPKPVIVKLVRERIEEEFQRFQTHSFPYRDYDSHTSYGRGNGYDNGNGMGGGRPGMTRHGSVITALTEMDQSNIGSYVSSLVSGGTGEVGESIVSHASEQFGSPAGNTSTIGGEHDNSYPKRRSGFGLDQEEAI